MINDQEYEAVMARHGVLQTFPVHQVLKPVLHFFFFYLQFGQLPQTYHYHQIRFPLSSTYKLGAIVPIQ